MPAGPPVCRSKGSLFFFYSHKDAIGAHHNGLGGLFSSRKDAKPQRNSSQFFAPSLLCSLPRRIAGPQRRIFFRAETHIRKVVFRATPSRYASGEALTRGLGGLFSFRKGPESALGKFYFFVPEWGKSTKIHAVSSEEK